MTTLNRLLLVVSLNVVFADPSFAADDAAALEHFEKSVRPIFVAQCQSCHNDKKQKGGLNLARRSVLLAGGDTGPAFVAREADKSLLMEVVNYNGDIKMPPKGKLTDEQRHALKLWIDNGAVWPETPMKTNPAKSGLDAGSAIKHWSLLPRAEGGIADGDLDQLILASLSKNAIFPAPLADRATLLRRVTIDLIGLPPTPAELLAFENDSSPTAYQRVVERLLASPHYGERWARHWLDLVRYAETMGHEFDFAIPNAWRYRDYVIRAFNSDLRYDQFVVEQLAGDTLATRRIDPTTGLNDSIVGTGFWFLGEAKHAPVDVRQDQAERIDNMIDVFGKTFLASTISCARCHDHKFDPIPTSDYYRLYGMLSSSRYQQAYLNDGSIGSEQPQRELLQQLESAGELPPWPVSDSDTLNSWLAQNPQVELFKDAMKTWTATGLACDPANSLLYSGAHSLALHGTLRSPMFTIEKPNLSMLVAGKQSRVNIIVDGFQLIQDPIYGGLRRTIGSEESFGWINFDLSRWIGRRAYVEFLDDGPGYFALRDLRMCDTTPPKNPKSLRVSLPKIKTGSEAKYRELEKKLASSPTAPAMLDGNGFDESIFVRGNHKSLGERVPRAGVSFCESPKSIATGSGRREFAEQLIRPENPLVARVWVNRVWQHHFGVGLVATPDDFGIQGQSPSHPELLDRLANQFIADGWSTKSLHRVIVSSKSYQQSSEPDPKSVADALKVDPTNKLLWRANVRRIDAETLRDSLLMVSGRLDRAQGGPSIAAYLNSHMAGRGRPSQSGPLDGNGRRSIYLEVRRNFLNPLFTAFDYPTPFTTIGRRGTSNVPAQALVLLNNPLVQQQAETWAKRVMAETPTSERLDTMYLQLYSRKPSADERRLAAECFSNPEPESLAELSDFAHLLLNSKEYLFIR